MLDLVDDLGRAQGKNILLCSHLLPDVERTCDHVIVLNRGTVAEQGAVADMTRGNETLLHVSIQGEAQCVPGGARQCWIRTTRAPATGVSPCTCQRKRTDADAIFAVAADFAGVAITSLDQARSSLEEVFLKAVGVPSGDGDGRGLEA